MLTYEKIFDAIFISLQVSVISTILSFFLSIIFSYIIAINNFTLKRTIIAFIGSLTSIPPVCAGLIVYLLISRSGPLGWMEILYTPSAMIIAQFLIIFPIMTTLFVNYIQDEYPRFSEELTSYGASKRDLIYLLIKNKRTIYMTVLLIGFGRAISEYGAAAIVGGSIDQVTRNMTSMIALETSKGNVLTGVILGIVLILLSLIISFIINILKKKND